ncbi:mitochondrial inner membrane signal peptidase [Chloropicon primus]|uniref:Mitochondrial inner membrane protease subunit 2 n=1 Tax=Chloropicon primus TaxID=1764295 RepID=A0A5B8MSR5_9CHLO|nr:mitochondrial inner membrane signal peptidase [Chloropicon primus]UPR02912.1 mitochondrial inner membrane signal peptidase [Chloropicon primus]|eukprot:QDZ23699.1 mitochondrial inner membrane signal peptidase [Chloropicon primus]
MAGWWVGRVARASAWILPVAAFADYVGTVERVPDDTMAPSLGPEPTIVWVDKFFCTRKWLGNDRIDRSLRGQVVYSKSPLAPDEYMIRRVVGLPGDWVSSSSSSSSSCSTEGGGGKRVHVGQGQIWVEGDNRNPSATEDCDSKFTSGLIPFGLVQGQVTRVVWPPSRMDRVRDKIDLTRSFPVGHGHRDDHA